MAVIGCMLSEPARGFSVLATDGDQSPPVNFQAGMQQPGILQPAEPDSLSIGHRRFTELIPGRVATAGPEPAAETTDEYLDLATFQPTNYRHVTSK
jgi:hypothetical protein